MANPPTGHGPQPPYYQGNGGGFGAPQNQHQQNPFQQNPFQQDPFQQGAPLHHQAPLGQLDPSPKQTSNTAAIIIVVVVLAVIVGGISFLVFNSSKGDTAIDQDATVDTTLGGAEVGDEVESRSGDSSIIPDSGSVESAIEEERQRDKVYWNLQEYEFLGTDPQGVYPGSGYVVETAEGYGQCSTGWIVTPDEQQTEIYMLTAGHCGSVGDQVYFPDSNGDLVPVGEFVWVEEPVEVGDPDYALIDITNAPSWVSAIPVDSSMQISGWRGAEWVREKKPYTCRIGARMGLSCGEFIEMQSDYLYRYENISNSGDSGGAVWAQDPDTGKWYAVGVTSFIQMDDSTNAGAVTIEPVMEHFELKILGPGPS